MLRPAHLSQLRPSRKFLDIVIAMLKEAKVCIRALETQIEQLLDRIVESSVPSIIGRYEQRIAELEREKLLMEESLQNAPAPQDRLRRCSNTRCNFLEIRRNCGIQARLSIKESS